MSYIICGFCGDSTNNIHEKGRRRPCGRKKLTDTLLFNMFIVAVNNTNNFAVGHRIEKNKKSKKLDKFMSADFIFTRI